MDAVAELVRERHHVARPPLVVHQHVRVHARHRRVAERAGVLARAQGGIDPAPREEAVDDLGERRREPAIGLQHDHLGVVPGHALVAVFGNRRIAIPVLQALQAKPARLERVIAMRQARIGRPDRGDQGVDHLVLDLIGEVARGDRARELAPAILQLLVLGQRVGDQGIQPAVAPQHVGDDVRGPLALRAVMVLKQIEDLGAGQLAAVEGEPQRRHGLVEQSRPCPPTGDRFLVQDLLDRIIQLMRAKAADVTDPWLIPGELRRRREPGLERLVLDPVELQGEKQDLGADRGRPLLHGLEEPGDLRILAIRGMEQLGVAGGPAEPLLDLLVAGDRRRERRRQARPAGP